MVAKKLTVRDARLFTYAIASADMRYIPINERQIMLRADPENGPIMRGEIAGCGADCYADFSLVLLEYVMSCEGCRGDPAKSAELVDCLGERLGRVLAGKLFQDAPEMPLIDQIDSAFTFLLRSMGATFSAQYTPEQLRYALDACPLHTTANSRTGLNRAIEMAHRAFVALCTSLLHTLAPTWTLAQPAIRDSGAPLSRIVISVS